MLDKVLDTIKGLRGTVVDLQAQLVSIPALGPENADPGCPAEIPKADFVRQWLQDLGNCTIQDVNAPDDRVDAGYRPNIAAIIPGKDQSRTFWIISHLDVVPSGDLSLWESDPFRLRVEDDQIFGRGVEDNHQGIVTSLLLAKALADNNVTPPVNYGILAVSDEETGSGHGLDYVLKHRPDLFTKEDLILVPDFGSPDSTMLEIAEKSMLWLKISVFGKQCHASTPGSGVNTLRASAALILELDALYKRYDAQDSLFSPSFSTFEPTKKEANVPNINTIPGLDVFYLDCRVLPQYDLQEVLETVQGLCKPIENRYGVRIEVGNVQHLQAPLATSPESEVVVKLIRAVEEIYGITPIPQGIGGGTVAAFLRKMGFNTAVWSTCLHNPHQPNEAALISSQVKDSQVFARMLLQS